MNLASLLYYFNNQHIFFQANLPNCVHFLTNFYVLPNFFSAWPLFFVFISACRKTRPVNCRTFLCRSCRKSSFYVKKHLKSPDFIRFLPCRIRKRLRLLLLRRFLKKAKKSTPKRRGSFLSLPLTVALLLTVEDQIVHIHDVVVQHSVWSSFPFF